MIFRETPTFATDREAHVPEDAFVKIQQFLASQPEGGEFIPGANGLRKARFVVDHPGKVGGGRVVYYRQTAEDEILLVAVFAKKETVTLTPAQVRALDDAFTGEQRTALESRDGSWRKTDGQG